MASDAGWSGEIISAEALDGQGTARIRLSWEGRDGQPIERKVMFEDVAEGGRFPMRVLDDASLDASFWADYLETTELISEGSGTRIVA